MDKCLVVCRIFALVGCLWEKNSGKCSALMRNDLDTDGFNADCYSFDTNHPNRGIECLLCLHCMFPPSSQRCKKCVLDEQAGAELDQAQLKLKLKLNFTKFKNAGHDMAIVGEPCNTDAHAKISALFMLCSTHGCGICPAPCEICQCTVVFV